MLISNFTFKIDNWIFLFSSRVPFKIAVLNQNPLIQWWFQFYRDPLNQFHRCNKVNLGVKSKMKLVRKIIIILTISNQNTIHFSWKGECFLYSNKSIKLNKKSWKSIYFSKRILFWRRYGVSMNWVWRSRWFWSSVPKLIVSLIVKVFSVDVTVA